MYISIYVLHSININKIYSVFIAFLASNFLNRMWHLDLPYRF